MSKSEHTLLGEICFNRALLFCMIGSIAANNSDSTLSKITVVVAAIAMVACFFRCYQESRRAKEKSAKLY